jgi:asparagine synthase (glutamine-hydrolysing)
VCGIYGTLSTRHPGTSSDLVHRMGQVIRHRGPDDAGQYFGDGVALGMRRLSIIDLQGGHQPISNEDNSVWVVCNGEIYNFKELRSLLEKQGHVFRSDSDTEVLVHLYEQEGLDFVSKLRGMFSLAIWDTKRSRLVLARDRLGKKPLYLRREPDRLLFASEIKSILEDEQVPRQLDPLALEEYLTFGYVPAPKTLFEGIEKLLPGHLLIAENRNITIRQYWDVRFDRIDKLSEADWIERIREKFLEAVRIRLVSDVPLGAFLSGGIDSSAIVAAMSRFSNHPVKTYSIGFEGEDLYYNELPYARLVAKAFRTDHHEIIVRPDVFELLPQLVWHLDEPLADSAFITTYLVSRLARESVTVILSGVGGDELFGGYRRYLAGGLLPYHRLLPRSIRSFLLPAILDRLPKDRHSGWKNGVRYASAFLKTAELEPAARYLSYVTVFSPELKARLLNRYDGHGSNGAASQALLSYFEHARGADELNQIIYADLKSSLADDLLALTDKMTMAASIECRAPFVDQELVELSSRMPSNLKVRGLTMKHLLKKALKPLLPAEILHRKKRGFGAPVGAWLRKDLDGLVYETLSEDQVRKRGLFDWNVVREVIALHRDERADHTEHLFALVTLELWCRAFLDTNPAASTSHIQPQLRRSAGD